jgi:hypothetical protein
VFEYFYQNNNGDTKFAVAKLNSAIDFILRLDCCLEHESRQISLGLFFMFVRLL